jgi:hypothetical protein
MIAQSGEGTEAQQTSEKKLISLFNCALRSGLRSSLLSSVLNFFNIWHFPSQCIDGLALFSHLTTKEAVLV